jgi:membrane fusion protein, multidrug efflux system
MNSTVALVLALAAAAALSACGKKDEAPTAAGQSKPAAAAPAPAAAPKGLPVKAVAVKVGEVTNEVTAVGSLLADESVVIRPEIDGRLTELHFQEGQAVARGAKLVSLDSSEVEAQLAAAAAQVRTDEQRLKRTKDLLDKNYISQDAYDVAENSYERSVAVKEEIEAKLAKTVIRAPFPGIVGLRLVSPGAYLEKGDDIARLENIASIKLDFRVPEIYAAQVRVGQAVAIRLDAFPTDTFTGRIYAMEPMVDERTRTVLLRARVDNQGLKLKPGMFVRVALALETHANAILVPEPAIWPQGQDSYVYRVVDDKAMLTKIEIGQRRPGEVEVRAGLSPGDVVITEGQIKMRDGAPVTVLPNAPPPTASNAAPGQAGGAVSNPAAKPPPAAGDKKG